MDGGVPDNAQSTPLLGLLVLLGDELHELAVRIVVGTRTCEDDNRMIVVTFVKDRLDSVDPMRTINVNLSVDDDQLALLVFQIASSLSVEHSLGHSRAVVELILSTCRLDLEQFVALVVTSSERHLRPHLRRACCEHIRNCLSQLLIAV